MTERRREVLAARKKAAAQAPAAQAHNQQQCENTPHALSNRGTNSAKTPNQEQQSLDSESRAKKSVRVEQAGVKVEAWEEAIDRLISEPLCEPLWRDKTGRGVMHVLNILPKATTPRSGFFHAPPPIQVQPSGASTARRPVRRSVRHTTFGLRQPPRDQLASPNTVIQHRRRSPKLHKAPQVDEPAVATPIEHSTNSWYGPKASGPRTSAFRWAQQAAAAEDASPSAARAALPPAASLISGRPSTVPTSTLQRNTRWKQDGCRPGTAPAPPGSCKTTRAWPGRVARALSERSTGTFVPVLGVVVRKARSKMPRVVRDAIAELRTKFNSVDSDNCGSIDYAELSQALQTDLEFASLITGIDASIDTRLWLQESRILQGHASAGIASLSAGIDQRALETGTNDGKINWKEFKSKVCTPVWCREVVKAATQIQIQYSVCQHCGQTRSSDKREPCDHRFLEVGAFEFKQSLGALCSHSEDEYKRRQQDLEPLPVDTVAASHVEQTRLP